MTLGVSVALGASVALDASVAPGVSTTLEPPTHKPGASFCVTLLPYVPSSPLPALPAAFLLLASPAWIASPAYTPLFARAPSLLLFATPASLSLPAISTIFALYKLVALSALKPTFIICPNAPPRFQDMVEFYKIYPLLAEYVIGDFSGGGGHVG